MSAFLRITILGILFGTAAANAEQATLATGVQSADETIGQLKEVLDASGVEANGGRAPVSLPRVAPPAPEVMPPGASGVVGAPDHSDPSFRYPDGTEAVYEPEVITAELAARVLDARARLDTLISAEAAGEGAAQPEAIAAAESAEKAVAALDSNAKALGWRARQMTAFWSEIQGHGFVLPENTVLYDVDQQRPFQERDKNPATTIEVSPKLVYATQPKVTYESFESHSGVQGGNIAAGDKFLSVGMLRTPRGRRLLGWVLGRGQIIVTENDIAALEGE